MSEHSETVKVNLPKELITKIKSLADQSGKTFDEVLLLLLQGD